MPGIAAPWLGAPPVAIRMYFAVTFLPSARRSVCGSSNTARVLTTCAPDLLDVGGVDALEPGDLLVLVGDQRLPVELDVADGPAETGGVLDLLMDVRAEHEQLFRHAAADHAGAAHPVFFGDHDLGAMAGRDAGGADAARAASDDEEIDVEFSHGSPAVPRMASGEWRMRVRSTHRALSIRYSPTRAFDLSQLRSACCASSFRCGTRR